MTSVIASIGSTVAMLAAGLSGSAPTPAAEAPVPPPSIDVVAINGSGCPSGTADFQVATDDSAVLVTFRQFVARAGGGAPAVQQRKNCQIILRVADPAHWSFALQGIAAVGHFDVGR